MTPDEARQVRELRDALCVRALQDIAQRANNGAELTSADLRTILQATAELPRAEPDAAPVADARHDERLYAWVAPQECARAVGVSVRWVQYWMRGEGTCTPAVETKTLRGRACVQIATFYEHVTRHARRKPKSLHAPVGYAPDAQAPSGDVLAKLPDNPDLALKELWTKPGLRAQFTPEERRGIEAWASYELRKRQHEERLAARLEPDEAARMLRGVWDWIAAYVEDVYARKLAKAVLRAVREHVGVDLVKQHTAAEAILDRVAREQANEMLAAWREHVDQQLAGIQALEGTA